MNHRNGAPRASPAKNTATGQEGHDGCTNTSAHDGTAGPPSSGTTAAQAEAAVHTVFV